MTTLKTSNKYFICNFKSLLLKEDFLELKEELNKLEQTDKITLVLCPPTTYLYIFLNTDYNLGSQEISMYENGAHTGENSAEQLRSLNVSYVLVGHHESRHILKENDNTLLNKIVNAYKYNIKPIYFIGETKEEKENNKTHEVLTNELALLKHLSKNILNDLIIVYEPIWSIGSGTTPTKEELTSNISFINNSIFNLTNTDIPIIYGGSINEHNINYIAEVPNLSGVILGESSTNIETLKNIYNTYKNII